MAFKLLFLFSLILGLVFLNTIVLVEHEDEISSLDKHNWGFAERIFLSGLLIAINIQNGELCTAMVIMDYSTLKQRSANDLWKCK